MERFASDMNNAHRTGYSAEVRLAIAIAGRRFAAGECAPDHVTLREAAALPDGPAELIVSVDGEEERWAVEIADRHLVRREIPIRIQSGPARAGAVA